MTLIIALVAFIAGVACGLALRPGLERRRQLRRAYAVARSRRSSTSAPRIDDEQLPIPRDYYLADRRQRGTLAEDFGLKRRSDDQPDRTQAELDLAAVPMPRDYYDRDTPDDEGTLAESYGLRDRNLGPG